MKNHKNSKCSWFFCPSSFFKLVYLADLQNVNITLRILFRPQPHVLPKMYMNLGEDYDERVLPSITTEVLKAVVVRFSDLFSHIETTCILLHSNLVVKCFISNCGLQAQFDAGELITQREVVSVGQEKNSSLVKESKLVLSDKKLEETQIESEVIIFALSFQSLM